MLLTIITILIGSFFGIHLLFYIFKVKPAPSSSAILHGFFVVAGLILLFVPEGKWSKGIILTSSLILFIAAAASGLILEFLNIDKSAAASKLWAVVHTLISVASVILLIAYTSGAHDW